jgi:hypothetical protein
MHIYNWYHSKRLKHSFMYTNTDYNIHGAFPLLFLLPLLIPLCLPLLPLHPLLLTWNPPSCDRISPPRSQVACKLTSSVPTLSPNPPPSKFPEPQLPSASLRRPQEQSGVFYPKHSPPEGGCCGILNSSEIHLPASANLPQLSSSSLPGVSLRISLNQAS